MDFGDWLLATAVGVALGTVLFCSLRRCPWRHPGAATRPAAPRLRVRFSQHPQDAASRIDEHFAALDQLIVEADQEIVRLQALLTESRPTAAPGRPATRREQQRCFALSEAGIGCDEIARRLQLSPTSVQAALDEWQVMGRRAA